MSYTADQLLAAHKANLETFFGLSHKAFEGVEKIVELNLQTITCPDDCRAALEDALGTGQRRIGITNGLQIAGPATLGSPERPILLVVEGPLQLSGGVQIHGAVVHLATAWDTSGTHDARIAGAVIATGNVIGDGTPTITYDRAVLDRLHGEAGVLVRVAGSWRDF